MTLSRLELANEHEIVCGLLGQLTLKACPCQVEPGAAHWQARVDCAGDRHWQSLLIEVDDDALLAAAASNRARHSLLPARGERLHACARNGTGAK